VTRVEVEPHLVGREHELSRLESFLDAPAPAALVLDGQAGAGKTALWEAGIEEACRRGLRTFAARPSGAEAGLSFAALSDLLAEVDVSSLAGIPAPQRHALEVALFRAEPTGPNLGTLAIATGLTNALRELAVDDPLLVAVDDVQWLDRPSADALAFAARRLGGASVRFLLAKRTGPPSTLETALATVTERLVLAPLSLGATRALLLQRLGLKPPRRLLLQFHDTAGGNPLFALELGRLLEARGTPGIGEELPVPDLVDDLIGIRIAALPPRRRRLLLALALSPDLRTAQLQALTDEDSFDQAVEDGLLAVDGDRVRPSHPLLAAAARKRARAKERRELHLELAGIVTSEGLQARHLALATTRPDAALAGTIAAAAESAAARGARQESVELAEHALRLTPADAPERSERILALAGCLEIAGERERVTDLLTPELESLPTGRPRVRAHLLLPGGVIRNNDDVCAHLDNALRAGGAEPDLRSAALLRIALNDAVTRVQGIPQAEAIALEALPAARRAGADEEREALHALAWARALGGRRVDDFCLRFNTVSAAAYAIESTPERVAGQRHVWRGETAQARGLLDRLLALADDQGEPLSYALVRLHLCELELRIGRWDEAERLLDEWAEAADDLVWPMYERCRAFLYAGRGLPEEAGRWATQALAAAEETGVRWDWLEAQRVRGIAALLEHDPARATESLRTVWSYTELEGVADPGTFPVAPELVEALVELGETAEAQAVTERLAELAEEQAHPWGLMAAARCAALVSFDEESYSRATAGYEALGLEFERARTLLSRGRAERRLRRWGAARETLQSAATIFTELGSPGWVEETRSELSRVGARRPQGQGELTKTEARVADLAAQGLSNKEIAGALFVTVHTVEVHLSHAYAKLGIRSRSQLGPRLAERTGS
jgi:DNA-binding CsgD family transcriptional regulator